jgi:2',3'-cyclic-nucleotide 2'-phosphodiesterase/3'-nucleotidase
MTENQSLKRRIQILATTDLHANAMSYDYYKDVENDRFGLAKLATLIEAIRASEETTFLIDNGDLIQGTPLAETQVLRFKSGDRSGQHPMVRIMNELRYDAATVGNHEFNYGLEYLKWVLEGASFSYINSNILNVGPGEGLQTLLPPYAILQRTICGVPFRLGVIGFVPPQIMQWDKVHLSGRVKVLDIQVAAKMFLPQLLARNVDAVVALSHSGLVIGTPGLVTENSSFALTKVPAIDVIVAGHTHDLFPSADFAQLEALGVDLATGTIAGKAVVMPGFWGSHLGVATLEIELNDGRWQVTSRSARVESTAGVQDHPRVTQLVRTEHALTQTRMRAAVGKTRTRLHTYFARIADSTAVQLINDAQLWYARRTLAGTEFEGLPILAASPPFRAGFAGESDYTDIPVGEIAMQHIADLYLYPNSFVCVRIRGSQVLQWLERSAENFNRIDVTAAQPQYIINSEFPTYNFDIFKGIECVFDLEEDVGRRVKSPRYAGRPLDTEMEFIVATNSYRANGGGRFPGLDGSSIIYEAPEVSAEVLLAYIRERLEVGETAAPSWSIKPFKAAGPVIFESPCRSFGLAPTWLRCETPPKGIDEGTLQYRMNFES